MALLPGVTTTSFCGWLATVTATPCTKTPLKAGSLLATLWLIAALWPAVFSPITGVVTSPAILKVLLPEPPTRVVSIFAGVLNTSKISLPPRPLSVSD